MPLKRFDYSAPPVAMICVVCDAGFEAWPDRKRKGRLRTTCSDECWRCSLGNYNRYHNTDRDFSYRTVAAEARRVATSEVPPKMVATSCERCGAAFEILAGLKRKDRRRFCSKECRYPPKPEKPKAPKRLRPLVVCERCSRIFRPLKAMAFCDRCRRSKDSHRKRARKHGVVYDPSILLSKLRIRDHGKCQICGGKPLKTNRSGTHPRNATIGHIVPLVAKGPHTWENVQLECLSCNLAKGTKAYGQLGLFANVVLPIGGMAQGARSDP